MKFSSEIVGHAFPIGNSMVSHLAYADRIDGLPSSVSVRLADLDQSSRELPAVSWDDGVDWKSDDRGEVEPGVQPNAQT